MRGTILFFQSRHRDCHRLLRLFFFILGLLSGSCAAGTVALEEEIARVTSAKNVGALVYGVVSKTEVISAKAFGSYSRLDSRAVDLDSIFRIGSISKTFTALLTLQLEHQGKLNTNLPVYHYLSKSPFTNLWSSTHPISAAQLLEHTAGLRDMSPREFDQLLPMSLTRAFEINPDSRTTFGRPDCTAHTRIPAQEFLPQS